MPRFKHDCINCQWVHTQELSGKWFDFYFCPDAESDLGGSLIARYADEGSQYMSSALSVIERQLDRPDYNGPLYTAYTLLDRQKPALKYQRALRAFTNAVYETGGLAKHKGKLVYDPYLELTGSLLPAPSSMVEMASAYILACSVMGKEPLIKEETEVG